MLVDPPRLALFLAASAALIATPGPAVLYIVARSLAQGRRAGLVSVLGIGSGNAVHAAAGALGLAALLASSPLAFAAVKWLGAGYLVYLGVAKMLRREEAAGAGAATGAPPLLRRVYTQAFVVAVLNPKTALFFLAFLPQFVDPARGGASAQVLFLGAIFLGIALVSDAAYALLAGTVGGLLGRHPALVGREKYLSGAVYVGLGLLAAFGA